VTSSPIWAGGVPAMGRPQGAPETGVVRGRRWGEGSQSVGCGNQPVWAGVGGGSREIKRETNPLPPYLGGGSGVPPPSLGRFCLETRWSGNEDRKDSSPILSRGTSAPPPPQIEAVRSYLSSHPGQEGWHNILVIAAESSFFHHFFNPRQMGSDPPRVPFTFFWRFFPLKNIT